MQTSECFQVDPDLFSCVGSRLVLRTPCGVGQWIHIVEEECPGQRAGKIDGIRSLKFSLLWCIFPQYALSKTSQMRATGLNT